MPLWAQLHTDLLNRVTAGDFDDDFPGEHALAKSYGVSRHTVRQALRQLRQDKVLIAERGRTTRLAQPNVIQQPLGALYSLYRSVEESGLSQRSVVRALGIRRDPEAAAVLELADDVDLIHLERIRMAGDVPLALDTAWLPASIAAPLLNADFTHTALYIELEHRCGVRPTGGEERISATIPTIEQASLLGLDDRTAALAIRRVSCLDNRPLEFRHTLIRADRFTVSAHFSRAEGYVLMPTDTR